MALMGKNKDAKNPVNILRDHIATYMQWVKLGKSKFRHKEEIGRIFLEMESTEYLFQQAVSGSMYDYRRKLERNVWAAAVHKYGGEMDNLKAALLRAVDACEAEKLSEEDLRKKEEEEAAEKAALAKLSLREQMAIAEEKEQQADAERAEENAQYLEDREASEETEAMTEADCRELWRIYQGLSEEFKAMQKIADRWIADNPEKGCLGVTLMLAALPVTLAYSLLRWLA